MHHTHTAYTIHHKSHITECSTHCVPIQVTEADHDLIFSEFVEALVRFAFAKHKSLTSMNDRDKVGQRLSFIRLCV
jgi:hypothetical protein